MEQESMKPCPFCGGEAKAFYCEESGTFDVQCQQCGAIPFIGSRTSEKKTMADVIAAWNARAAVADEQFAMAVHDGRAWQKVRTCHMSMCDEDDDDLPAYYRSYKCDACGKTHARYKGDDYDYCPRCGAKVAG